MKSIVGLHYRRTQHIRNSLDTKLQLNQTILNFWIKFAQKGCFYPKVEKVSITIEFSTLELV